MLVSESLSAFERGGNPAAGLKIGTARFQSVYKLFLHMKSKIAGNEGLKGEFAVDSNDEFEDYEGNVAWELFHENYEQHKVYFDKMMEDLNLYLQIDDNMYYFVDRDYNDDSNINYNKYYH